MKARADILHLAFHAISDNRLIQIGREVFHHLEPHLYKIGTVVHGGKFLDRMKRVVSDLSLFAGSGL